MSHDAVSNQEKKKGRACPTSRLLTNPVDFRRGFVLQIDCAWEIGGGSGCQEAADADLASGED
ncbi:hypothetical protein P3C33_28845, partial [Mesorhizobium sp. P16.1]|uniref:hypothetical protein n=2 Tax=Mesorhizobium TaxID=68287 RepID=UPI0019D12BD6